MPMRLHDEAYHDPSDWEAVGDLLRVCQGAPPVDRARYPTLWRLRILVMTRLRDPRRDARLWRDDSGGIIGFAAVFRRPQREGLCELGYFVRPDYHGTDATTAVLIWALARAREIARESGGFVECWGDASGRQPDDGTALEHVGFVRLEPYVQYMETALAGPPRGGALPDGYALRTLGNGTDLDAYLALYNAVSSPLDRGHKEALMRAPEYDPALNMVVVAPDGSPAAFCEASLGGDTWADGRRVGWIDHMGTQPHYQRRGLGEAVLREALQRLRAAGAATAALFTSSRNVVAQRLYARLGFYPSATAALYTLDIAASQQGQRR